MTGAAFDRITGQIDRFKATGHRSGSARCPAHDDKGPSLSVCEAGDGPVCFYVTRWGLVRELLDLAGVRDFAVQVGARDA